MSLDKNGHSISKLKQCVPSNQADDFSRIINVSSFRKYIYINSYRIPYDSFILRITPNDQDTYLKMIESNLSSRFEIKYIFILFLVSIAINLLNKLLKFFLFTVETLLAETALERLHSHL